MHRQRKPRTRHRLSLSTERLEDRHLLATLPIISEIMYHPASEHDAHEFVELWNAGAQPIRLADWSITGGIDYAFPDITLAAGELLAVAADVPAFEATYGLTARVVGPWNGRLSNSSDTVTLRDADGRRIDQVTYADEGDWAQRAARAKRPRRPRLDLAERARRRGEVAGTGQSVIAQRVRAELACESDRLGNTRAT